VCSSPDQLASGRFPYGGDAIHEGLAPGKPVPTRKEWVLSFFLLAVTSFSMTFAGLFYVFDNMDFADFFRIVLSKPALLLYGLPYSIPLIAILLAHEMGHFMACRHYGLRCTPPYFIPVPISITGTLGAFIKIKSPFRNKRALFDVGIAGPLAGFLVSICVLCVGISLSEVVPKGPPESGMLLFGEPLIFRAVSAMIHHYDPSAYELVAHPTAMAGWFGLLVTSLNLFPAWQLDGGHIAYAVFGPKFQKKLSVAALVLLVLIGLSSLPDPPSYAVFGIFVFILSYRQKFYHPVTARDWEPLGTGRRILAVAALIVLILCFTPVPVSFS
jgi:membrane-associated protease RseP (regulator of RpoE activity)